MCLLIFISYDNVFTIYIYYIRVKLRVQIVINHDIQIIYVYLDLILCKLK